METPFDTIYLVGFSSILSPSSLTSPLFVEPGREADAIAILQRIIRSGAERPSGIIYQLTRHFLDLLKAKAGVGQGGYRYERSKRKAQAFSVRGTSSCGSRICGGPSFSSRRARFPEETLLVGAFMHSFKGAYMEFPLMAA